MEVFRRARSARSLDRRTFLTTLGVVLFATAAAATVVYANFGLLQLADGGSRAGTLSPSVWLGPPPTAAMFPSAPTMPATTTTATVTVGAGRTGGAAAVTAPPTTAVEAVPAGAPISTTSTTLSFFDRPVDGRDFGHRERSGTLPDGSPPPTRFDDD